jgi:plasmid stabilization system protein ParE
MRPVIWSAQARRELDAQIAYITAENPHAARRVKDRIFEVSDRLGQFATGRRGRLKGTYEQVVVDQPYVVIYRIRRSLGTEFIEIARLMHTSRDWPGGVG